mmetsp:Transcript_59567/g.174256  ORF Transcript_59567/g.174256 Transcript_59567/m.174256 type:complete len:242 (-) Transcript_59567:1418-2143(-)
MQRFESGSCLGHERRVAGTCGEVHGAADLRPRRWHAEGVHHVGLRPLRALRRAHARGVRRRVRPRRGQLGAGVHLHGLQRLRHGPRGRTALPDDPGAGALLRRGRLQVEVANGRRCRHWRGRCRHWRVWLRAAGLRRYIRVDAGPVGLHPDWQGAGQAADALQLAAGLEVHRQAPGSLQLGGLLRQVVGLGRGELQLRLHLCQLADRLEEVALRLRQTRLQLHLLRRAARSCGQGVLLGAA